MGKKFKIPTEKLKFIENLTGGESLHIATKNQTKEAYFALKKHRGFDMIVKSLGLEEEYENYKEHTALYQNNDGQKFVELVSEFRMFLLYKILTTQGLVHPIPPYIPPHSFIITDELKKKAGALFIQHTKDLAEQNGTSKALELKIVGGDFEAISKELGVLDKFQEYKAATTLPNGNMSPAKMDLITEYEWFILAKICFPEEI